MGADPNDLSLSADVAEINREAQRAVDRVIAARVELDAAIQNVNDVRTTIANGSADAVGFIDTYMNPSVPNPPPIAPEVAAPPPAVEPPVFTDVSSTDLTIEDTSGGSAPDLATDFVVVEPPPPPPPAEEHTASADGTSTDAPAPNADAPAAVAVEAGATTEVAEDNESDDTLED